MLMRQLFCMFRMTSLRLLSGHQWYMVLSRKKKLTLPSTPLLLNGQPLSHVTSIKYLGVILTNNLTWSEHVNSVCMKATRILGRIFRKYYYHVSYSSLLQLYTSLVLPHLEYASAILWSPFLLGDKTRIENVQKLALRMCSKCWGGHYDHFLICLHCRGEERFLGCAFFIRLLFYGLCYFDINCVSPLEVLAPITHHSASSFLTHKYL